MPECEASYRGASTCQFECLDGLSDETTKSFQLTTNSHASGKSSADDQSMMGGARRASPKQVRCWLFPADIQPAKPDRIGVAMVH
jgi:hypothetical protein